MAWLNPITWTDGQQPDEDDFNAIGLDIRTWGGNVDAGGYDLVNVGSISGAWNLAGRVSMTHDAIGAWTVRKPDGSLLSVVGTTTDGLQEALDYAHTNQFPFVALGGGPNDAAIHTTTTVAFPLGWQNSYDFFGVVFWLDPGANSASTAAGITFDSCDLTHVDFHDSQIIYSRSGAAVHFLPTADMGESFAGFTTNTFKLGHIVCVLDSLASGTPLYYNPDPLKGTCIRISLPALGLGLTYGNGICVDNQISAIELNGGAVGMLIDNPSPGSPCKGNTFNIGTIHNQGTTCWSEGTTAAAAGRIHGNTVNLGDVASAAGVGLSLWSGAVAATAGGNNYTIGLLQCLSGVVFRSSAQGTRVTVASIICTTNYTNSATEQSNRVFDCLTPTRGFLTVGASPWVYQNQTLKPVEIQSSGGTVSALESSLDGSSWIGMPSTFVQSTRLQVGGYLRWTFSVAPNILRTVGV